MSSDAMSSEETKGEGQAAMWRAVIRLGNSVSNLTEDFLNHNRWIL